MLFKRYVTSWIEKKLPKKHVIELIQLASISNTRAVPLTVLLEVPLQSAGVIHITQPWQVN